MRVLCAVALLVLATVLVHLGLAPGSLPWLGVASGCALLCGWAAARILHSELEQSRREVAADRAAQAQVFRTMDAVRAAQHAELTASLTNRLSRRDAEVADLRSAVVRAERRASEAEARVQREARRAVEAQHTVQLLSGRVAALEAGQVKHVDKPATGALERKHA